MARDDKELNALLQRIGDLERTISQAQAKRKNLDKEEDMARQELAHIKKTVSEAIREQE